MRFPKVEGAQKVPKVQRVQEVLKIANVFPSPCERDGVRLQEVQKVQNDQMTSRKFLKSAFYALPVNNLRKSATIKVNTAEPMIAQTTGKGLP